MRRVLAQFTYGDTNGVVGYDREVPRNGLMSTLENIRDRG
jgi:hypothetical protein